MENQQASQAEQKPKVTIRDVQRNLAISAEGHPLLGNCIYWSFTDMKLSRDEFLALLSECGIDGNRIAPSTKDKSAVHKALRTMTKGNKRKFHRKAVDDEKVAAFSVVQEQIDVAQQDISFQTELKVSMDKSTKALSIQGSPEESQRLRGMVDDFKKSYTTDQIRAAVLRYTYDACSGVMVREGGGIYFIPSTKNEEFKKLRQLFDKLQAVGACSVNLIPVVDGEEARKSMWKSFTAEVASDLKAMRDDIDNLDEVKEDGRLFNTRMRRFDELSNKVGMYEFLLNETASDLRKELEKIKINFREKLMA